MMFFNESEHVVFKECVEYFMESEGRPLGTAELKTLMQFTHPDLCDDDIKCVHREEREHPDEPEWHHTLRGAQQGLVRDGKLESPPHKHGLWCLVGRDSG